MTFLVYISGKHLGTRTLAGAPCKLVLPQSDSNGITRMFSSARQFQDSGESSCALIDPAAGQISWASCAGYAAVQHVDTKFQTSRSSEQSSAPRSCMGFLASILSSTSKTLLGSILPPGSVVPYSERWAMRSVLKARLVRETHNYGWNVGRISIGSLFAKNCCYRRRRPIVSGCPELNNCPVPFNSANMY